MRYPFRYIPPLGPPKPTAREQALADWRGVNLAPLEKAGKPSAQMIGTVMKRVLEKSRFDQRLAESQIVKVWSHLIDPLVAQHAQPVGLRRGTLFVRVDSHVWLDEIVRYRRREILDRLQHGFGREMIKRISYSVG